LQAGWAIAGRRRAGVELLDLPLEPGLALAGRVAAGVEVRAGLCLTVSARCGEVRRPFGRGVRVGLRG